MVSLPSREIITLLSGLCARYAGWIFADRFTAKHRFIWGGLSLGMAFLAINKQLDLQTWFQAILKGWAYQGGWYDYGQKLQIIFLMGLALVSLGLVAGIGFWMRHVWWRYLFVLLGVLFLARFIIVRAATFFGVSLPKLSAYTGGLQINWLLEIVRALVIAAAAAVNLWTARSQAVPPPAESG